jgi:hypothetical protein
MHSRLAFAGRLRMPSAIHWIDRPWMDSKSPER